MNNEVVKFKHMEVPIQFIGNRFRLPNLWEGPLFHLTGKNLQYYINTAINYCEIGIYLAINFIVVEKTFARNKDSKMIGIDPWKNYIEMDGVDMSLVYKNALNNMLMNYVDFNKIKLIREESYSACSQLENDYFDIIYVDGYHSKSSVLEDMVLYFRKLKVGGIMIMDDAHDESVLKSIQNFVDSYKDKVHDNIAYYQGQVYFMKK
jgi:hypothetical protein